MDFITNTPEDGVVSIVPETLEQNRTDGRHLPLLKKRTKHVIDDIFTIIAEWILIKFVSK